MNVKKQAIENRIMTQKKCEVKLCNKLTFEYKGIVYPNYLRDGNALSFILPIARYFCHGHGLDIGGTEQCSFPGTKIINIDTADEYHAMKLPNKTYDFIISSHALEHLKDPYFALERWTQRIKQEGVLFLYLPHEEQEYWTFDNPKHLHAFTPTVIKGWLERMGYEKVLCSGQDMYWSFAAVGFKK
jgi:SAM-dependent methyltransferase